MFLDTSGLLCHQYTDEIQHLPALRLFESSGRKLTHSYVLAEFLALVTARRLNRAQAVTFLQYLPLHPLVEIIWVDQLLHEQALALIKARPDKAYSLYDAVSFVLMKERGLLEALTTDHHFEQEGFRRLLGTGEL
jgi:predicted nucleic acid-binding protein